MPPVSILVSSKDRRVLLREAVASLRRLDYPRSQVEIVVVEETDSPENPGADRYVSLPRTGKGFAWSRNAAVRAASHALVAFTDDDCLVDRSWLRELMAPFEDPKVAAVAGGVLAQPSGILGKTEIVLGFPGGGLRRIASAPENQWASTRELSTVNAATRRDLVVELGGFCEETGIYGGEDSELFSRLTARHRAVFNPRALVFHRARDSAPAIARWFYRRGLAQVTLAALFSHSAWDRILGHARTSFLLRFACLFSMLFLLGLPIVSSMLTLALLYYALMLVRYRYARRAVGWSVLLLTPLTKLLMDVSFDIGRLAGLVLPRKTRTPTRSRANESRVPVLPTGEEGSGETEAAARPTTPSLRPSRVLLVENSGSVRGGGQMSFLGLMEGLDRSRYDLIATCPEKGDFFDAVRDMGIPTFVLPMPSLRGLGWLSLPRCLWIWRKFIRRHAVDLVHANGSRAMIYAGIAGRLASRPVVWHVRVLGNDGGLDRLLARLSTRILVNSQAVARRFDFLKEGKTPREPEVVPNGVDVEAFARALPDATLSRDPQLAGRYILVVLAQLVPWKRHELAIEMLAVMKQSGCGVALVLLGDEVPDSRGYRARLMEKAAQLDVSDECLFAGFRKDVPAILKLADLLIHPATPEPFGRALIEAMAVGVPVVAAAGGGVLEVIDDGVTGTVVTSDNPACWARIVEGLLRDEPLRRRMGGAARRRAEIHFSKELHAQRVQRVYQEVLSSSP